MRAADASLDKHIEAKTVRLSTGRTILRLEPQFWTSLGEVAGAEQVEIGDIVERAEREWPTYSRSAAVRVYLTEYYRTKFIARASRRLTSKQREALHQEAMRAALSGLGPVKH